MSDTWRLGGEKRMVKQILDSIDKRLSSFQVSAVGLCHLSNWECDPAEENKKIKESVIDLQARSMRLPSGNFWGAKVTIKTFMKTHLKLREDTVKNITFHRVHRREPGDRDLLWPNSKISRGDGEESRPQHLSLVVLTPLQMRMHCLFLSSSSLICLAYSCQFVNATWRHNRSITLSHRSVNVTVTMFLFSFEFPFHLCLLALCMFFFLFSSLTLQISCFPT